MSNRKPILQEDIQKLKDAVQKAFGRRIVTPSDYTHLADLISVRSKLSISSTTLKRVWGYISDTGAPYQPSYYTLRALVGYLGYTDFDDFLNDCSNEQSAVFMGAVYNVENFRKDTITELSWSPNRLVRLKYTGGNQFEVIESFNAKLQVGDIVHCTNLVNMAPAYFNVKHTDGSTVTYIAGSRSGVNISIYPPPN